MAVDGLITCFRCKPNKVVPNPSCIMLLSTNRRWIVVVLGLCVCLTVSTATLSCLRSPGLGDPRLASIYRLVRLTGQRSLETEIAAVMLNGGVTLTMRGRTYEVNIANNETMIPVSSEVAPVSGQDQRAWSMALRYLDSKGITSGRLRLLMQRRSMVRYALLVRYENGYTYYLMINSLTGGIDEIHGW
jgi:hypothetical protein